MIPGPGDRVRRLAPPLQCDVKPIVKFVPDRLRGRCSGGNVADAVNVELLKRLCATPGIAGREDQVRAVVVEELRPLVDELRVDALGSVIGTNHGTGPRVM